MTKMKLETSVKRFPNKDESKKSFSYSIDKQKLQLCFTRGLYIE